MDVNVESTGDLIQFVVWCVVVFGVAAAIFRSFPAQEIASRLLRPDPSIVRRAAQLQWEITHKLHWDPDLAKGDDMTAGKPLLPAEVEARHRYLHDMQRRTLLQRAAQYALSCRGCHVFWAGVLVYLLADLIPMAIWFGFAIAGVLDLIGTVRLATTGRRSGGSCGG